MNFDNYHNIQATIFTDLEAPGWFDGAWRSVRVLKDGVQRQYWERGTNQNNWEFTEWTSVFPIESTGKWEFIVKVWGVDYGALSCPYSGYYTGKFSVIDL